VLFVGRLERVKGVATLLDALLPTDTFATTVAGAGSQDDALRRAASRRGLGVAFVGAVDAERRNALLSRARVLVVPSIVLTGGRTEGAPVVVAEALAAGVPVVASRVGGIDEMIDDGATGLLVAPGDPVALRDAILQALAWDADASACACRRAAQRHRQERFGNALERLFGNLLQAGVA
jgi:glycosyltransferase involved in cell wall biosynthesis